MDGTAGPPPGSGDRAVRSRRSHSSDLLFFVQRFLLFFLSKILVPLCRLLASVLGHEQQIYCPSTNCFRLLYLDSALNFSS
jgi:hypothetical protein